MEPQERDDDLERRRTERLSREKSISLLVQLVVLLAGVVLLVYGLISYSVAAPRLTRLAPQAAFLPVIFAVGIVYFALRSLAVYRQFRRHRRRS